MLTDRQTAIKNNLARYQGSPCLKGHSGVRYTISSNCAECLRHKPTGKKAGGKPNEFRQAALRNGDKFYFSKPCKKCGTTKRITATSSCVSCREIYMKTVRRKNERKYSISKYGITIEQYDEMLVIQNNVCAICEQPEISLTGKGDKTKPLAIDHCHETGKVRKLLCSRCNIGIGSLKHNPDLLRKAALYCEET